VKHARFPLTGITRVSRLHRADIQPPKVRSLQNFYVSQSDNTATRRGDMVPLREDLRWFGQDMGLTTDATDALNTIVDTFNDTESLCLSRRVPFRLDTVAGTSLLSAVYSTGTVTADGATLTVTGASTLWVANVWRGCYIRFLVATGIYSDYYLIDAVNGNTSLTLNTTPIALSGVAYEIAYTQHTERMTLPAHVENFGQHVIFQGSPCLASASVASISSPLVQQVVADDVGSQLENINTTSTSAKAGAYDGTRYCYFDAGQTYQQVDTTDDSVASMTFLSTPVAGLTINQIIKNGSTWVAAGSAGSNTAALTQLSTSLHGGYHYEYDGSQYVYTAYWADTDNTYTQIDTSADTVASKTFSSDATVTSCRIWEIKKVGSTWVACGEIIYTSGTRKAVVLSTTTPQTSNSWTIHDVVTLAGSLRGLASICHDGTRYVAVSRFGAGAADGGIWSSTDLTTWAQDFTGGSSWDSALRIATNNTTYVVTGANSSGTYHLFHSANRTAWTQCADVDTMSEYQIKSLSYSSDLTKYLAVQNKSVVSSTTGATGTWAQVGNAASNGLTGASYNATSALYLAGVYADGTVVTSPDGTTWTTTSNSSITLSLVYDAAPVGTAFYGGGGNGYSLRFPVKYTPAGTSIYGVLLSTTTPETSGSWTSHTIETKDAGDTVTASSVCYDGTRYVVCGQWIDSSAGNAQYAKVWSSTDLSTWANDYENTAAHKYFYKIATNDTTYVATSLTAAATYRVSYSADRTSWADTTAVATMTLAQVYALSYDADLVKYLTLQATSVCSSTNGSSGTWAALAATTTTAGVGLVWVDDAGYYVVGTSATPAVAYSSTTGAAWGIATATSTGVLRAAVAAGESAYFGYPLFKWTAAPASPYGVIGTAAPDDANYRCVGFLVLGSYLVHLGCSDYDSSAGTMVYLPQLIRWPVPGGYSDFTGTGSGNDDGLAPDVIFLDGRTVGNTGITIEAGGMGALDLTGDTDAPFSYRPLRRGFKPLSNPVVVDNQVFIVGGDGLLYQTNGVQVTEFPTGFDATEYTDISDDTRLQLTHDRTIASLIVYEEGATSAQVIALSTGNVSEITLPTFTALSTARSNVQWLGSETAPTTNDDTNVRGSIFGYGPTTGNVLYSGFIQYDPDGTSGSSFDTLSPLVSETAQSAGLIQTGSIRLVPEGLKAAVRQIYLRTYGTGRVAVLWKPFDETTWLSNGETTGTISVTNTTATGTGTAWSNKIADGDDTTVAFTLPCVATIARVYLEQGSAYTLQTIDTDYTTSGKTITFVTAPTSAQDVYAYWDASPEIKVAVGDLIQTTSGYHRITAIATATSATLSWGSDSALSGTHIPCRSIGTAGADAETFIGVRQIADLLDLRILEIDAEPGFKITDFGFDYDEIGPKQKPVS